MAYSSGRLERRRARPMHGPPFSPVARTVVPRSTNSPPRKAITVSDAAIETVTPALMSDADVGSAAALVLLVRLWPDGVRAMSQGICVDNLRSWLAAIDGPTIYDLLVEEVGDPFQVA